MQTETRKMMTISAHLQKFCFFRDQWNAYELHDRSLDSYSYNEMLFKILISWIVGNFQ